MPVALEVQVPPDVELVKVVEPLIQSDKLPVIGLTVGKLVTVELGIDNVISGFAPADAMDNEPEYVPALADALNLIKTVVVVNVPALVCANTKLVEYVPELVADISNPVGAVKLTVVEAFKLLAEIVIVCALEATP